MTSAGKGGAGGPAKGLTPAHFFPLEGTDPPTEHKDLLYTSQNHLGVTIFLNFIY